MKEEVKNFSVIFYINMVDISRETYERNCIEAIVDNNEILWLSKKHIEHILLIRWWKCARNYNKISLR